jgi:S1-C subfamily serine protease
VSQEFYEQGKRTMQRGIGSGVIIDQEGRILTNYHVAGRAAEIYITLYNKERVPARLVGDDHWTDLAIVQMDPQVIKGRNIQYKHAGLGTSATLIPGQDVIAIGTPHGFNRTMTLGVVSNPEQTFYPHRLKIDEYETGEFNNWIQMDTPINPGNSGGPLLNLAGQVIGVNAQISTESGSNSGIGYAIPADLAARVAQDLINNGRVEYSYIGIQGGDVDLAAIETLELPNNLTGVLVTNVVEGGPAALGGLRNAMTSDGVSISEADIITSINGEPLSGISELISYLAKFTAPGDVVTLTVYRGGETVTLEVTLQPRPR